MKHKFRQAQPFEENIDANNLQDRENSIAEQDTVILPSIQPPSRETIYNPPNNILGNLPVRMQHLLGTLLNRAQDPEPEIWSNTLRKKATKPKANVLGWLSMLSLSSALGLLLTAYAIVSSIQTGTDQQNFLWLGLLLIFIPPFLRLISPTVLRAECIVLICIVDLSIYLVKVVHSPNSFSFFDEYLHWRTVNDIVSTGHLFSLNSLIPISPLYPGLEIVTDAFSSLSGLNTFTSALIIVGISRILMILSLFMLFEQITKSSRIAAIAVMLYMCSPNFFLFDSNFLYESLGLTIGTFMMYALARMETLGSTSYGLLVTAWIAMGALVATHHVSFFFFMGLLVVWAVLYKFPRILPILQSHLAKTAFLGLLLSVVWVVFVATPVVQYLGGPIHQSFVGIENVLTGTSSTRTLFVDYSGHPAPIWQRLAMLSSLVLVTLGVPFGCVCIWHRYRYNALALMLGLISLLYPLSQTFRLISSGADLTFRAAPYLFIPTSFTLAIFITQFWPTRFLKRKQIVLITFAASLVFLGGALLSNGPAWVLMPGSYVVEDDARTINSESIQASLWTLTHLGPNNRMATDRSNSILLGTYGDQRIVDATEDKVDVSPVFYSTKFYSGEVAILQNAHIQYLFVDLRLSTALPYIGFYYEETEPEAYHLTSPISKQALTKFDAVPQINREFDSGNIIIYDVGELTNASEKP